MPNTHTCEATGCWEPAHHNLLGVRCCTRHYLDGWGTNPPEGIADYTRTEPVKAGPIHGASLPPPVELPPRRYTLSEIEELRLAVSDLCSARAAAHRYYPPHGHIPTCGTNAEQEDQVRTLMQAGCTAADVRRQSADYNQQAERGYQWEWAGRLWDQDHCTHEWVDATNPNHPQHLWTDTKRQARKRAGRYPRACLWCGMEDRRA